jgi:hypothetical protein
MGIAIAGRAALKAGHVMAALALAVTAVGITVLARPHRGGQGPDRNEEYA